MASQAVSSHGAVIREHLCGHQKQTDIRVRRMKQEA